MTDSTDGRQSVEGRLADLRAVATAVAPGDDHYPAAGDLAVAERILARLNGRPEDAAAFDAALRIIGGGTTAAAALSRLEAHDRPALQRILQCVYAAYYEDAAVRAVLAARHGYEDRPPQPIGYHPEPGAEQLARLDRRRGPTLAADDWWLDTFDGLEA